MWQRLQSLWPPIAVLAQAFSLAIWWTWFNQAAFGTTYLLGWSLFFVLFTCCLGLWYYIVTILTKRWTDSDPEQIGKLDILAGSPLLLLPLVIPGTLLLVKLFNAFPMKVISNVWLPFTETGKIIGGSAYLALLVGGSLIMLAILGKIGVMLHQIFQHQLERLKPWHYFFMGFFALVLFLSWPAIISLPHQGEINHLLVTQALSYDTAFHIEGVLDRADFYRYYPSQAIVFNGYVDGLSRLFIPVAPGMPLLFITFYMIAGRWGIAVLTILFAAGAGSQLAGLLKEQRFQPKTIFMVWLITLFTAPILLYGYQATAVTASVFFLSWGLRLIMRVPELERTQLAMHAALVGLIAGLMWLGGVRYIAPSLIMIGFLAFQLFKSKQSKLLGTTAIAMVLPAFFAVLFYTKIYSIFAAHPVYQFNLIWRPEFWLNLLAMVSDRATGILWHGPIWILGLATTIVLIKLNLYRSLAISIILIVSAFMIFGMIMPDPRAEGSSFNRLLAAGLPLTAVGVAFLIERLQPNHWLQKVWPILAGWSMAVAVLLTLIPDLNNEAVRVKLLEHFQLVFVYDWLPDIGFQPSMLQCLVGTIICLLTIYFIYKVVDQHPAFEHLKSD